MWNLENDTDELICKAEIETEKTNLLLLKGKVGGVQITVYKINKALMYRELYLISCSNNCTHLTR